MLCFVVQLSVNFHVLIIIMMIYFSQFPNLFSFSSQYHLSVLQIFIIIIIIILFNNNYKRSVNKLTKNSKQQRRIGPKIAPSKPAK